MSRAKIAKVLNVPVRDVSVDESGDIWVTQCGHGYWILRGSDRYADLTTKVAAQ